MRVIFTMLRIPNLLIIALTFLLLRYLVFIPVYSAYSMTPCMNQYLYILMILITALIAAAGYISNDYFDVATDRTNKLEKLYIGKHISPGSALGTALLFSFVALSLSIWLTLIMKNFAPAFLLILALSVTWWYAIRLKKSFIWGNIAVSCLSAGTIAMAWIIEAECSFLHSEASIRITAIIAAISIFAFLLSLLREIVKDIEDMEGDKLIRCKSVPIKKGVPFTKKLLLILVVLTLALLIITQIYLASYSRWIALGWLLISVELPLVYFAVSLNKAQVKTDYHKLSTFLKWIMLGGIATLIAGQF